MAAPLRTLSPRAITLSLGSSLFIAIGNLRNSFLFWSNSWKRKRCSLFGEHRCGNVFLTYSLLMRY